MQAQEIEKFAESADVSDRGHASQICPSDLIAPFPVSTALVFGVSLKLSVAKSDIQLIQPFAELSANRGDTAKVGPCHQLAGAVRT